MMAPPSPIWYALDSRKHVCVVADCQDNGFVSQKFVRNCSFKPSKWCHLALVGSYSILHPYLARAGQGNG